MRAVARTVCGGNRFFLDDEARKSVQGVADHRTPLTPTGRAQAEQTGVALRRTFGVFDYAYHSGYRRTSETLQHLLAAYPDAERAQIRTRHHLFCASATPVTPTT